MYDCSRVIFQREDVRVREIDRKFTSDGSYVARYVMEIGGEPLFRHFVSLLEVMDAVATLFAERDELRMKVTGMLPAAEVQCRTG